jgi:hypothetical protein
VYGNLGFPVYVVAGENNADAVRLEEAMEKYTCLLSVSVLLVCFFTPAWAQVTLTGEAYIDAGGDLRYKADDTLIWATDGGSGTEADPFIFDLGSQNLDLNGYHIEGNSTALANQRTATWRVGSILNSGAGGDGSFYSGRTTVNGYDGATVRIEAEGSITVNNVRTESSYAAGLDLYSGAIYLEATNGPVTVAGYLSSMSEGPSWNAPPRDTKGVTVISRGTGAGIMVMGGKSEDGIYSIRTDGYDEGGSYSPRYAGNVKLQTDGNIVVSNGISAYPSGRLTITGATARAGDVYVGGNVVLKSLQNYGESPDCLVHANSFLLEGNLLCQSQAYQSSGGNVDIDVIEECTIRGYVRADMTYDDYHDGSSGHVYMTAKHTRICGTNVNGVSILTDPNSTDTTYADAAGDGDVVITGTDSSLVKYDIPNPTNGLTSSIFVAGKIDTGYGGSSLCDGDVTISAVEVQLGGDIDTEGNANTSINIHYGVKDHGIVTHLMEDEVYWDEVAPHNISYINANGATTFTADVPYAGIIRPPPSVIIVR